MKILACGTVYNNVDILPYLIEYYKVNGIDLFIYDNMSDDGTWESLREHGVECEQFDTGGKFSTVRGVRMRMAKWDEAKPDWCIYLDADEFPLSFRFSTLKELIEQRDKEGFNIIRQPRLNFRPTGTEDFSKGNPLEIYRYYFPCPGHFLNDRVFKYSEGNELISTGGHYNTRPGAKVSIEQLTNPIFHYSIREHGKAKVTQMANRTALDEETTKLGWNTHLKQFLSEDKWVWNKDELKDMKDPADELYKAMESKVNV